MTLEEIEEAIARQEREIEYFRSEMRKAEVILHSLKKMKEYAQEQ